TENVDGHGEAAERVTGRLEAEVQTTGVGRYYDDGHAGMDEAFGRRQAERAAQEGLDAEVRARLQAEGEAGEAAHAGTVQDRAERAAEADLARRSKERRAALDAAAAAHVTSVGVRARQAFHGLLARAYRDVLLALARQRGADVVTCDDRGDVL